MEDSRKPFVLEEGKRYDSEVVSSYAGATVPLQKNTLMARDNTNQEWVPFENPAATDGKGTPAGIFLGEEISAADLIAGSTSGQPILIIGDFDRSLLSFYNDTASYATVITATKQRTDDYLISNRLTPVLTGNSAY